MTGVPLNIDWQQILLHLFNFVILFAILYTVLYKPVKNFMEKREEYYKNIDDQATCALKDAEATKADYVKKMEEAEASIRHEREKARTDLEKATQKRLQDATLEAQKIVSDAKAEAENEKRKIINSAQTEISQMVTDATEKLALKATASEAFDQFLDATERSGKNGQPN